ncbi:MAG TPA: NlpC/P60 family protein [Acidimicrobiia bacterium]|nr:NlpC/P60 family protein [Acidimicrobiia bacterium]
MVVLTAGVSAALAAAWVPTAGASPIDDKKAQAAAIQSQIEANSHQIEALGERYDGAVLALQQAEAAVADASARIDATRAEVRRVRDLVRERAASVYRSAASGGSLADLDVTDAQQLLIRNKYAEAQSSRDDAALGHLGDLEEQLAAQKADAEHARDAADSQRHQIADAKAQIEQANVQQQQLLKQVQGELAQLIAQEQARRAAAALAAARARFSHGVRAEGDGNPEAYPNLPPNGPVAAAAIEFARAQLGKPYVYAAAGPDSYDCSGLVMAAFRSAGVSLPHYSGAMYQMLPHVPLDSVQVGDLLFWGPGGSEHVAIYVGDGKLLEAGGSTHIVHIGPIWGHPSGAARVVSA